LRKITLKEKEKTNRTLLLKGKKKNRINCSRTSVKYVFEKKTVQRRKKKQNMASAKKKDEKRCAGSHRQNWKKKGQHWVGQ